MIIRAVSTWSALVSGDNVRLFGHLQGVNLVARSTRCALGPALVFHPLKWRCQLEEARKK